MTEEAHTTIAPATASRRAVLTGIAAIPIMAAVPFASTVAEDPIVAMLRRRSAMDRAFDALPEGDDVVARACDEAYEFECTIIGTPVLSIAGAAMAFDAIQQKYCCDDLDEWLIEAVGTFFRSQVGETAYA